MCGYDLFVPQKVWGEQTCQEFADQHCQNPGDYGSFNPSFPKFEEVRGYRWTRERVQTHTNKNAPRRRALARSLSLARVRALSLPFSFTKTHKCTNTHTHTFSRSLFSLFSSVCLSVRPSVRPSVRLSVFLFSISDKRTMLHEPHLPAHVHFLQWLSRRRFWTDF